MISTAPAYPLVINLHGSVLHYTDQNLESETQKVDEAASLHPFVLELAEMLRENFQLVPIGGFDECLEELNRGVVPLPRKSIEASDGPPPIADLDPASDRSIADIDRARRFLRLSSQAIENTGERMSA